MEKAKRIRIDENINSKKLIKSFKMLFIMLLVVVELIICIQSFPPLLEKVAYKRIGGLIACSIILATLVSVDSFMGLSFLIKMYFFFFDTALLLVITIITSGSSYLYVLYCIVLTQFYITIDNFNKRVILFGISILSYIGSMLLCLAIGDKELFEKLAKDLLLFSGDILLGAFIISVHFVITNFILQFYKNSLILRRALKEADESRKQLKSVYEKLSETAVFEERNRIAKDIHDNAGHSLTTVIMQTEAAKLVIDNNPEEAKKRIISANIQAKNALEQMRESVHILAGRMQTTSIKDEIEEIIAQTIGGTEFKIRFNIDEIDIEGDSRRFICNTIKECLANGIRHGSATAFYIEMKKEQDFVTILISDNGKGCDGEIEEGFGLRSIREKCEKLGGKCYFSSEKEEGFEVKITLPTPIKETNND